MATVVARPLVLRRWERWEPLTGALFALLFFVGQDLLVLDAPGESASAKKISSFYADKGNYHQVVVGKLLVTISVVFLVWFVALLTTRGIPAPPSGTQAAPTRGHRYPPRSRHLPRVPVLAPDRRPCRWCRAESAASCR